jgi:glycerol-3-phosphate acyltransferase PlsY
MVPTLLALTYVGDPGLVALVGLLSVVGHIYPVWLGFRGGKGVATTAGVILPIAPDMFLIGLVFFIAIVFVTRYVSLASMSITVLVLLCMLLFQKPLPYSLLMLALSLLVIYRHSENIARLLNGTENKIGAKKK